MRLYGSAQFMLLLATLVVADLRSFSSREPSIVRVLMTSTVTVSADQSAQTVNLQRRQWDWTPSTPVWTEPAPVWTAPASSWAEQPWSQPAWTPAVPQPQTVVTALPSASPTYTYNETHRPNKKETLTHAIIAAIVIGVFVSAGFVGCAITYCVRKCNTTRPKKQNLDVEMAAGNAGFQVTPTRGGLPQEPPPARLTRELVSQIPSAESDDEIVHWSRERGYVAVV
ncbi:hypothetical protein ACN47E_007480 [Coniothyrium glycines]